MPGGRRFGAPTLEELDTRLGRIERSLLQRESALVRQGDAGQVLAGVGLPLPPIQPQGMRLVTNVPGSVVVEWNPVPNRDVIFYELQVSETPIGAGTTYTLPATQTRFDFREGSPGTEYFFRVRVVTTQGRSDLSATVSSETGRAQQLHLQIGAAKHTARFVQTEFDPSSISRTTPGTTSAEYGFYEFETLGGPVLIFMQITSTTTLWGLFDHLSGPFDENPIFVRIKEDGETIHQAESTMYSPANELKRRGAAPYVLIQPAAPGLHIYSFEVELHVDTSDPSLLLEVELHEVQAMFVELRA